MKQNLILSVSVRGLFLGGCALEEPEETSQPKEEVGSNAEENDSRTLESLDEVALLGVNDSEVAYSYYFVNRDLQIYEGNIVGYGIDAQDKYIETIESVGLEIDDDEYVIVGEDFELRLIKLSDSLFRNPATGEEYMVQ